MGEKNDKKPAKKIARLEERAAELRAELAKVSRKLSELGAGDEPAKPVKKKPSVSRFARPFPDLPEVRGVRFAAAEAGVRYAGRKDVMLAEICAGASVAGVLTRSATRSGPVDWVPRQSQRAHHQRI